MLILACGKEFKDKIEATARDIQIYMRQLDIYCYLTYNGDGNWINETEAIPNRKIGFSTPSETLYHDNIPVLKNEEYIYIYIYIYTSQTIVRFYSTLIEQRRVCVGCWEDPGESIKRDWKTANKFYVAKTMALRKGSDNKLVLKTMKISKDGKKNNINVPIILGNGSPWWPITQDEKSTIAPIIEGHILEQICNCLVHDTLVPYAYTLHNWIEGYAKWWCKKNNVTKDTWLCEQHMRVIVCTLFRTLLSRICSECNPNNGITQCESNYRL